MSATATSHKPPAKPDAGYITNVEYRGKTLQYETSGYRYVQLRRDGVLLGSNDAATWTPLKPIGEKSD